MPWTQSPVCTQCPAWMRLHGRREEQYRACYWECMQVVHLHMHNTAANEFAATSMTVDEYGGTLSLAPEQGHHNGAPLS